MQGLLMAVIWICLIGVEVMASVPQPWTPVTFQQRDGEIQVGIWGRKYHFAKQPLPSQITTAGVELLAQPMRLAAFGESGELSWVQSGCEIFEHTDKQITLIGWQVNDAVIANFVVRVEFDGLMRVDLTLAPLRKPKASLQRLWLEIPLRKERASLFHYWPGRWGSAENSGAVPTEGKRLPFKPVVWLGWEEGGLTWCAESDQSWQVAEGEHAIEIVPKVNDTILRVHFLDTPPQKLPLSFTFGIQATPVKPLPKDFHEWRICHGAFYGMEKQPLTEGGKETALDKAGRLGVRMLVFHEEWTPIQNYWRTNREAELRQLVAACHQRGIKLLLYFSCEISTLAPEWTALADQVLVKTSAGRLVGGYFRQPPQRDYVVCLHSQWAERLLEGIVSAIERYGFDGVYLDGTVEPHSCANEAHGCGYRTGDGRLKETYPIFAVRHFMRRLYEALHPKGKLINAHQSTYCGTPTLAFVHSYWDGEQFGGGELAVDPLQKLPLESFRAEFMGKNFGVPCEFLVYERPPDWTVDHALAFTLLHDVRVRPLGFGEMLEKMSEIWNAMTRFGVSDAEWYPYWRIGELCQVEPETVKVSGYKRVVNGQVRWLLVVSNLSAKEAATAKVRLTKKALPKSRKATDALTGENLPVSDNGIVVPLSPMRMRLIEVQ
ncbi:MAG: glycoside hydrolase domain-containing protein [Candidatus Fervidibacter sp.]|uniref:glycoside hydrolase domain-containing protein n=1 Tax=Candidatus Fervidibacter sp. TaxID=3100871 RepID=UPI00404B8B81